MSVSRGDDPPIHDHGAQVTKYDIKKDPKYLYGKKNRTWELVEVPIQRFIAIEGHGDPNTSRRYVEAVEALYPVAYAIKAASKRELGRDFVVGPLEGLWWADDPTVFVTRQKEAWSWRLLIAQPEWVDDDTIERARETAAAKRGAPAIADVHPYVLEEGLCAQILHVGSYDDEGPALEELHSRFVPDNGLEIAGLHHEIYLSDARRTDPSKLRTILRQPVRRVAS